MPASSPALASSSSTLKPRRSAQRISMRRTISAQSWASVPPGARVHGHERVARVVAAGEQALLLELGEAPLDGHELLLQALRELGVLVGELGEAREILRVGLQRAERLEPPLQARMLGAEARRALGVVPEAGRPHLVLQVRDPGGQLSWVKDSPRAAGAGHGSP